MKSGSGGYKLMLVLVDRREQLPYFYDKIGHPNFPDLQIDFATLQTGDYSVQGFESPDKSFSVAVERKSKSDLFGSLGQNRPRFENEFTRLSAFTYAALVIEADFQDILFNPPPTSQMNPKSVFRSLLAWSQRFNVHVFPCPNRSFAEKCTFLILHRFYLDHTEGGKLYKPINNNQPCNHHLQQPSS